MAGLSDTGLEIKTLDEVDSEIEEDIHGNVSSALNLSSTSALGQYKGSTASQIAQVWEALQALYASWDVRQATGDRLDALGALVGITRRQATYSTVTMTLTLAVGTYAPGSLIVSRVGDPTARFSNADTIVISVAGTSAGHQFIAEDTGPVQGPLGQLTVIANPITGFTGATNPGDAIVGDPIETNAQFRRRRDLELALMGSTTVDAIRADLLQAKDAAGIAKFDFASVVENDGDTTDGAGRPPHSFEALLVGGSDADAAAAVYAAKPAGIRAYGTTVVDVTDSQNNVHHIGFTRPTDVPVYFTVGVNYIAGKYPGDDYVAALFAAYGTDNLGPGNDVVHAQFVRLLMETPGVVDGEVAIGTAPGPLTQVNLVIAPRELATFATGGSRFIFVSTPVGGVP
jgi:uncharacterized phage protein gp47/JayE